MKGGGSLLALLWEAVWLHETEEGFARDEKLTANLLTAPPLAAHRPPPSALLHLAEPPRPRRLAGPPCPSAAGAVRPEALLPADGHPAGSVPRATWAEREGSPPTEACQCQQQADRLTKTPAPAAGAVWPARWMEVTEGEPTHRGRASQAIQQGAAEARDDPGQQAPLGGWPLLCHAEVPAARLISGPGGTVTGTRHARAWRAPSSSPRLKPPCRREDPLQGGDYL